ncbi:MAG: YbdD/YjiX family protein [Acidobacteriia bacterium]|jgi:hypothetical protein|nr:YbdD/YjiX family protein [Terriglobia bacterium]
MHARSRPVAARLQASALRLGRKLWWYLRQVSGDAAYENYLRRAEARRSRASTSHAATGNDLPHRSGSCDGPPLLSAEQFYLDVLRRRYSGVSRCC